jgi:hypothetical protein
VTNVILTSATVSITVNNVENSYSSPVTYDILFGLGLVMANACVILTFRMKHLATKLTPLVVKNMA